MNNRPGKPRRPLLCCLVVWILLVAAVPAWAYEGEYFWDTDPGYGRAVAFATTELGNESEMEVSTDGLSPGVHLLGVRIQNGGRWSPTVLREVMVTPPAESDTLLCEYWWDSDPGYGKGLSATAPYDGTEAALSFDFRSDSLAPGMHTLGYRVNYHGQWSPTLYREILVPEETAEGAAVLLCEYWWDSDPGYGKGISFTSTYDGDSALVVADFPTDTLSPGMHTLGVRVNNRGNWSDTYVASVAVDNDNACSYVSQVEYFWGEDPGYGNGTPIDIVPSDSIELSDYEIPFPVDSTTIEYTLTIRARTAVGWGPSYVHYFVLTPVDSVAMDLDETVMVQGDTLQLTATVYPDDAYNKNLFWYSSNDTIVAVDSLGRLVAGEVGFATVYCRAEDGGMTDSCTVVVVEPYHPRLTWTSSAPEIVSVDTLGRLTALAAGEAEITCLGVADTVAATCFVIVKEPYHAVERIELSCTDTTLLVGDTLQLTAAVYPANASDPRLTWTSSAPEIVSVDTLGRLTALAAGLQLTAAVYPANASDPRLTWTSSAPEIVSVDTLGRLTALAAGEARITVWAEGGLVSSDCVVKVETPSSALPYVTDYRIYSRGMTIIIESSSDRFVKMNRIDGIVTTLEVRAGVNYYEMEEKGLYFIEGKKILLY